MDAKTIRAESIRTAERLGVDVSSALPLLEPGLRLRSVEEVVTRILAMHAVAATAYGLSRAKAISWINDESLTHSLSERERRFIFEGTENASLFRLQIEGMWALAWALGLVDELDFAKDCDSRFVMMLPNLKQSEGSAGFRRKVNPRPFEQIVASFDLAYCLHWAIRQSELSGSPVPGGLRAHVVVERRRALEWMLGEEPWEQLTLDT